jgi:hypothetical protein
VMCRRWPTSAPSSPSSKPAAADPSLSSTPSLPRASAPRRGPFDLTRLSSRPG